MYNQKKNRTLWLAAALIPILILGCIVAATGGAFARYRADRRATIEFTVRPPDQVYLGMMVQGEEETLVFDPTAQGTWKTIDQTRQLEFTIANGIDAETCAKENQRISLRLIGTLGIWDGVDETFKVILQLPPEEEEGEEATETTELKRIEATVTRIREGSPMYSTFGDGWVFAFFDGEDEARQELSWLLEGGTLDTLTLTLILEGAAEEEVSLLQLQISGIYAED